MNHIKFDAELRVHMRAEIGKLQKRLGITAVYVTHDQVEAMTMGDRIAVLHDGELRQVGTPLELYDTPQNVFVAQFIGTPNMNMLEMTLNADGTELEHPAVNIKVPEGLSELCKIHAGKALKVGLRPEHVRAQDENEWNNKATIQGEVEIIETLGHEIVVHFKVEGSESQLIAKMDAHKAPKIGDSVTFDIHTTRLHLFSAETDERLS
jgi:ABC-type sugar transport systems, ATPase components